VIDSDDAWMSAMRRGDFPTAWRISDAVLRARLDRGETCFHRPRHLQFVWNGATLRDARVIVRCYHGLGDTIQFVSLLPRLRKIAREVVLWAQPKLLPLLEHARGIDRLEALTDGSPEAEYDVDIEIMELPHALRLQANDLADAAPYIYVSPAASFSDGLCHVGLVTVAGGWDALRSIPPHQPLTALSSVDGIAWHSLQYPSVVTDFPRSTLACADIVELASRIEALDLVITVDTMTAHLAGALGQQVWLLLSEPCDWRWMQHRNDSPWYPTMRLFRQPRHGDWASVLEEVSDALRALAGATRARDIRSGGCTASSG
jgi:hypothetical protein